MDRIEHRFVEVKGIKLHVAEIGKESSPAVVFLHGFPEIWYSWRHQMIGVANAGFRAIAPDFRGYGLSDHGVEPEKTSFSDLLYDTVAILDSLNIFKVRHQVPPVPLVIDFSTVKSISILTYKNFASVVDHETNKPLFLGKTLLSSSDVYICNKFNQRT